MLDERKAAILRAVVEEYIDTAQPVGSAHVAAAGGCRGVVGHGPQRHGGAGAGGLPPPAPHQRRPGPHREGLPLLRRLPRRSPASLDAGRTPCRCARSSTRPTASSSRCCRTPAGSCRASPTTPRVVVGPPHERATDPLGPARRPRRPRSRWWWSCCRTASVEKRTLELAEHVGEERWPRPPPTSRPRDRRAARCARPTSRLSARRRHSTTLCAPGGRHARP